MRAPCAAMQRLRMRLWVIQMGDMIPGLDGDIRPNRSSMLTETAAAAGHDVVRWGSTFRHQDRKHRAPAAQSVRMEANLEVRLLHGCGYRRNRSPSRFFHHRQEARSFLEQAESLPRPDVLFCCLPTPQLCAAAIDYGQRAKVEVVLDVRDLWPDHYLTVLPGALRPLFRPLLAVEYRKLTHLLQKARGITAISRAYLDWALKYARRSQGPREGIFPLGYPTPEADPQQDPRIAPHLRRWRGQLGLKDGEHVILFVGSFVSSFDFRTVIESARTIHRSRPDLRFVFVGSGGFEEGVRRSAQGLPNTHFVGWVQDKHELAGLLAVASAGISPYRRGCTMSLPNKPFEYMSAGLPQLNALGGELATIIEREGIGINYTPDDASHLTASIEQLFGRDEERRAMGERARALFHKEYASSVVYPRLLEHLASLAGSRLPLQEKRNQ